MGDDGEGQGGWLTTSTHANTDLFWILSYVSSAFLTHGFVFCFYNHQHTLKLSLNLKSNLNRMLKISTQYVVENSVTLVETTFPSLIIQKVCVSYPRTICSFFIRKKVNKAEVKQIPDGEKQAKQAGKEQQDVSTPEWKTLSIKEEITQNEMPTYNKQRRRSERSHYLTIQ